MSAIGDDVAWMQRALAAARRAARIGEVPVGAVVVRDNHLLASGNNRCIRDHDASAHAEIVAIRRASKRLGDWRLEGCTLYVTLEPCPMCVGACLNARVQRIVYAAPEPKAGACGSLTNLCQLNGYNHHLHVTSGVLAEQSSHLLKNFFAQLRKARKAAAAQTSDPAAKQLQSEQ
ncbi:MAG: nucleoside deaminase [Planctomycetota bacterium]|nr:MAG: nucleoside deaminase [Planctomycetota bacterium]